MKDKVTNLDLPVTSRQRIAVVSPFVDKQHGTERCVAEQIERLARDYEIHLYSNNVRDVDLSNVVWHRVPKLPGPHLFAYCWWILANHFCRWRDRNLYRLTPSLVYSPGVNCFDADVISVHIVFGEFYRQVKDSLKLKHNPVSSWPRILHRRLYYSLVSYLEQIVYRNKKTLLSTVSGKVVRDLERFARSANEIPVLTHGIDRQRFRPESRIRLRESSRKAFGLTDDQFCLLLVGNDWKNKGLAYVVESMVKLGDGIRLLVVGSDVQEPYLRAITQLGLNDRIRFLPPRPDVEFYYAAADLYVAPSLEDAFCMPPLEAMACRVPCIISSQAGVSEVITDGVDGLILEDPKDSARLADLIALVRHNGGLRNKIAAAAATTAQQYTWQRNAQQLGDLLQQVLRRNGHNRYPLPCASVSAND